MLRCYRDFMPAAPDELTAYAGLISTPDGTPAVGAVVCYCGDLTEGERVLKPAACIRFASVRRNSADAISDDGRSLLMRCPRTARTIIGGRPSSGI
jgi:hypothetical protein